MIRTVSIFATLVAALAGPAPGAPIYYVDQIEFSIAPDTPVSARTTTLCLLGPLRWQQVPTGKAEQRREIVRSALAHAGLQVSRTMPKGGDLKRTLRVRAVVSHAGFDLCKRPRSALRFHAVIASDWYVEAPDGSDLPHHLHLETVRQFGRTDAVTSGAIIPDLLRAAATDAVHWLTNGYQRLGLLPPELLTN